MESLTLAERIAKARFRGITQVELAKRSGVSQGTISGVSRGRTDARSSTVQRLARAIDELEAERLS